MPTSAGRLARVSERVQRLFQGGRSYLGLALVILAVAAAVVTVTAMVRLIGVPLRYAGPAVEMGPYGVPGVTVRIIYPTQIGPADAGPSAKVITVLARAASAEQAQPFELLLPLPDEALAYVGAEGQHVAGRLYIVPGYPEATPFDLRVAHGHTQYRAWPLFPYRVPIVPLVREGDQVTPAPELQLTIRLVSRWEQGLRHLAETSSAVLTPLVAAAVLLLGAAWGWHRVVHRQKAASDKRLATLYQQLREQVKLDRWTDARDILEQIRLLDPHYRDLDRLDTVISAAETADWRREQLYRAGCRAYQDRNWPDAVHALQTVEAEAPYYREVRFLRRTAALYADLQSRDRSLRLRAAQDLGNVADLLDMTPLLHALGDRSQEVADAAESSFRRIGLDAFEALLAGLVVDDQGSETGREQARRVRERSYHLIEQLGQSARESLLGALRSSNPQVTAAAASLLIKLGARQEVADSLVWANPPHREGLLNALWMEGAAAAVPLVQALLKAPPDREQYLIDALVRLKSVQNVERHLAEVMRSTKDKDKAAVLKRVLDAPAGMEGEANEGAAEAAPVPAQATGTGEVEASDEAPPKLADSSQTPRSSIWPLRLLDRRRP